MLIQHVAFYKNIISETNKQKCLPILFATCETKRNIKKKENDRYQSKGDTLLNVTLDCLHSNWGIFYIFFISNDTFLPHFTAKDDQRIISWSSLRVCAVKKFDHYLNMFKCHTVFMAQTRNWIGENELAIAIFILLLLHVHWEPNGFYALN